MSFANQDAHFMEAYGYRPSRAQHCPRVVAGKRCRAYRGQQCAHSCICLEAHARGLLDHVRVWLDPVGGHVLTSEPYDLKAKRGELAAFRAACHAFGLRVDIGGYSPWYPGHTTLIRVVSSRAPRVGRGRVHGDSSLLEVIALRHDGSRWCVEVRTMRQAIKVARRLRWRKGWPTWIDRHDRPADQFTLAALAADRARRAAWQQTPIGGVH